LGDICCFVILYGTSYRFLKDGKAMKENLNYFIYRKCSRTGLKTCIKAIAANYDSNLVERKFLWWRLPFGLQKSLNEEANRLELSKIVGEITKLHPQDSISIIEQYDSTTPTSNKLWPHTNTIWIDGVWQ
jgi:hypothetical protein